jgi:hypothetical protein
MFGALSVAGQGFFPGIGYSETRAGRVPFEVSIPTTPGAVISDIEMHDESQRVFVSIHGANTISVFGYDGSAKGQVPLIASESLALDRSALYAVDEGAGSIVRINPESLQTTLIASGMDRPRGLTFTGGSLYTVVSTGPGALDRVIVMIDPTTGTKKLSSPIPSPIGHYFERLMDPSPQSGVLFGTQKDGWPRGLNKLDVKDLRSYVHVQNEFVCEAALENGEILVGRGTEFFALSPASMSDSNRRWPVPENSYPETCDSGSGLVALTSTSSLPTGSSTTVQFFDQNAPGRLVAASTFPNGDRLAGPTAISAGGSLFVIPFRRASGIVLDFVPVTGRRVVPAKAEDPEGPSTATTSTFSQPRSAAPSAGVAVRGLPIGRVSGPGTLADPTLLGADDWLIDPAHNQIVLVHTLMGRFAAVDARGLPLATLGDLAQPASMTLCNNKLYVALYGTGEVLAIDQTDWTTHLFASGIGRVRTLICSRNVLFAVAAPPMANTGGSATLWKLTNGATSVPLSTPSVAFGRYGSAGSLYANAGMTFARYDDVTLAETLPRISTYPAGALRPAQPLHFNADGTRFLDYAGRQYDARTLELDGVEFPGTNVVRSHTDPAYIATRPTGTNSLLVLDAMDPTSLIRQITISSAFQLLDLEFAPNSATLYALVRRVGDGQMFVRPLPDVRTGAVSNPDPVLTEMLEPSVPGRR